MDFTGGSKRIAMSWIKCVHHRKVSCVKVSWPRVLVKSTICLLFFSLSSLCLMMYMPTRNALLGFALPGVWIHVDTQQIIKMHVQSRSVDVGTCPESCPKLYRPKTRREDVLKRDVKFYDDLAKDPAVYKDEKWKFLPLLNKEEKTDLLYTLDVMGEVLERAALEYFLVDGTLLGLIRHAGIVPWDDDIDVALNGSMWLRVKDELCCVEGFTLRPKNYMHWKFFSTKATTVRNSPEVHFPFLDMFFFMEDAEYLWSMTNYNLQNLVARKTDIFPLSTAQLEGKSYPVPRRYKQLLRRQFKDLSVCVSPSMFHKYNHALHGEEVSSVPCDSLRDIYPSILSVTSVDEDS